MYKNGISKKFLHINFDNKDLPKFVTKKWIEVYDQSEKNYKPNKEIRIKNSILRSDLCGFNDTYIFVKGSIIVNKTNLLLMILKNITIQQLMQLLLIMQIIMLLMKKIGFSK